MSMAKKTATSVATRPKAKSAVAAGSKPKAPLRKAPSDTKPQINKGEEEWAELIRGGVTAPKNADWFAKGVKSVEVCLED